jgi:hypothetical protein
MQPVPCSRLRHDGGVSDFFSYWFDSEYRQRRDINSLQMQDAALSDTVQTLSARIAQLRGQLNDLSLTVAVLVKMLQEANVADPKVLQYRVEAEKEAIAEAAAEHARALAAASPHASPSKTPTPVFDVRCDGCGNTVPSTQTTITERGTMCNQCQP